MNIKHEVNLQAYVEGGSITAYFDCCAGDNIMKIYIDRVGLKTIGRIYITDIDKIKRIHTLLCEFARSIESLDINILRDKFYSLRYLAMSDIEAGGKIIKYL